MTCSPTGPILTAAEMRAAELTAGCSLSELMNRAGGAIAEAVWRYGCGRPALFLCGPGNNGGDGYVAARLLKARGLDVRVAALRESRADIARAARALWGGAVEALGSAAPAPVLVDCLFGTGLARPLEADVRAAMFRLSGAAKFRIAVDLPSGLGTDDGGDMGAVGADLTLALGSLKPAHLLQPGAALCGTVRVADIGIDARSQLWVNSRPQMSVPSPSSHKYKRGYVAMVGGAMGGATMLAARAAMPLAGYVTVIGARRVGPDALVHRRWEEVAEDSRVGAMLVGPGLGRDEAAQERLNRVLATGHALVLDADALKLTTPEKLRDRGGCTIVTPHEGEFSALFGVLPGGKVDRARAAALLARSIVILKGADTVIAHPDGRAMIQPFASGWLATAGSGDVLAGIVAAQLAERHDPFWAACEAVWLHAEAARLAGPGLTADALPRHIPRALAACL